MKDRERQRETERDRERQRETERYRERQRETERYRERQRKTEMDLVETLADTKVSNRPSGNTSGYQGKQQT